MHRLPHGRGSVVLFLSLCVQASAQIAIVSAASYRPLVAPNSLASIFGSNIANSTTTAQLDANKQLPTQLAGVTVQINGTAASLLYVSPGQINFLVPPGTVLGTAQVSLQPTPGATPILSTMQVGIVAPGLFSQDATGTGPGAILDRKSVV